MTIAPIVDTNVLLRDLTTLKVGGPVKYFAYWETISELRDIIAWAEVQQISHRVIGGGSNILCADTGFAGVLSKCKSKKISYRDINDVSVEVTADAGVVWDELVVDTVNRGLWGLENLSYIPGSVGAAPVQNIGAYGTDVSECIKSVKVFDLSSKTEKVLSNSQCCFSYRDSVFKHQIGSDFIVTEVTFVLQKSSKANIAYKDIEIYFADRIDDPSVQDVRRAVIEIRQKKFPAPTIFGTAGSFFKNPIVERDVANCVKKMFPQLPLYNISGTHVKISAAWLIEHIAKQKGKFVDAVGMYENHALVLVTADGASSVSVKKYAEAIQEKIKSKTGIMLEWEVQEF